jgi:hypothetical protein
MGGN